MHWIDPSQLPRTIGVIERFLINPHGEYDGLILRDGTEVHFPPHLSQEVGRDLARNATVCIQGVRLRRAPVLAAIALQALPSGRAIVDNGPDDDLRKRHPRRKLEVSGMVVRPVHGPKGEVRGALLDDGTMVRVGRHADPKLRELLVEGQQLAARGEGVALPDGISVEANEIGATLETMKRIERKDHPPKPPKERKEPKPEHAHG